MDNWLLLMENNELIWWGFLVGVLLIGIALGIGISSRFFYNKGKKDHKDANSAKVDILTKNNIELNEEISYVKLENDLLSSTIRIIRETLARLDKGTDHLTKKS